MICIRRAKHQLFSIHVLGIHYCGDLFRSVHELGREEGRNDGRTEGRNMRSQLVMPEARDSTWRQGNGKANSRVPPRHVLIYSFGDDMYRKVQASALHPCLHEGVHHFCKIFMPSGPSAHFNRLCKHIGLLVLFRTR
jgi:hypothetical protein